jgi:tetratricopeptide (TPR) repeat protein
MRNDLSTLALVASALLVLGACSDDASDPAAAPASAKGATPAGSKAAASAPAGAKKAGKPAPTAAPDSAEGIFAQGLEAAMRGDVTKALEEYRRALAVDPGHAGAHFALGAALVPQSYVVAGSGMRDFAILDEAIEHLERAAELEDTAEHAYWLGRALDLRDRKEEALAKLEHALELDPTHGLARKRVGLIQVEQGRPEEALESFRKALETLPDDPGIHFQIGIRLEETDPEGAKAEYEKAIAIDPTFPWAYHGLATVLARLGDEEGHARVLEEGKRWKTIDEKLQVRVKRAGDNPKDVEAQISAGEMFFALHRREDALQMFRRALALDQSDPNVHMYCGILLREEGELEIAMNHLEESCYLWQQQGTEQVQPVIELALVYHAMENEARVNELVAKADGLLAKSEDPTDHLIAAHGLTALGREAEALRQYELVLAADPENEEARQALAEARPQAPNGEAR